MRLSRRDLLRSAIAAGVVTLCPRWLHANGAINDPGNFERYLVLVELDGGNDGLNTFVPLPQIGFYNARRSATRLSGAQQRTFAALPNLGLNWNLVDGPGTGRFQRLAENGELAVVLGLGMPNPNRSHFRGIDIWNTGSNAGTVLTTGWLQRGFVAGPARPASIVAEGAILSRPTSNPLIGNGMRVLSMRNADSFVRESQNLPDPTLSGTNALRHVLGIQKQVVGARTQFEQRFDWNLPAGRPVNEGVLRELPTFTGDSGTALFPSGDFGDQCRWAAQLIAGGVGVPIIKIRIGGFDTHSTQFANHNDLLAQLAHGLTGLRDALAGKGMLDRTLIMTYSEFGRRIEENGSAGTDHGVAAPHVVIGHSDNLNANVYGTYPSLGSHVNYPSGMNIWNDPLLDRGDMIATMDYRRLYASGLNFLGLPNVFSPTHEPVTGLLKV